MLLSKAIFLLFLCICSSNCHEWEIWQECQKVPPQNDLAIDKFLGLWYVMQQTHTDAKCLTLNYTRVSETSLKVTKLRQFSFLDNWGVNHTNYYSATLDIPFADKPGFMRIKWPLNMLGKGDYIVFDTDYVNYAGVYDCQDVASLGHRMSAAILSRKPELEPIFVERIKRRLETLNISAHFDVVSHTGCTPADVSRYNVGFSEDTVKNIYTKTVDTLSDAAQTVSTGVQGAWSYLLNRAQRFGVRKDSNQTENIQEEPETIRK